MKKINEIAQEAINAFEGENNAFDIFERNARLIYNHFACHPNSLSKVEHPYLIGIVYFYLEGALRDNENIAHVCFENACYCFAKVMNSESSYEKQCAAIRLFLLMNDNESGAYNLCHKVFKKNCRDLMGIKYERFRIVMQDIDFINQIKGNVHQIKSYCFSIFKKDINYSFISYSRMSRLEYYIRSKDYEEKPSILGYIHSNKHFFELFYEYLELEINNHNLSRTINIPKP